MYYVFASNMFFYVISISSPIVDGTDIKVVMLLNFIFSILVLASRLPINLILDDEFYFRGSSLYFFLVFLVGGSVFVPLREVLIENIIPNYVNDVVLDIFLEVNVPFIWSLLIWSGYNYIFKRYWNKNLFYERYKQYLFAQAFICTCIVIYMYYNENSGPYGILASIEFFLLLLFNKSMQLFYQVFRRLLGLEEK